MAQSLADELEQFLDGGDFLVNTDPLARQVIAALRLSGAQGWVNELPRHGELIDRDAKTVTKFTGSEFLTFTLPPLPAPPTDEGKS